MMRHGGTWPRVRPLFAGVGLATMASLVPANTYADVTDSDGVYGRLDGDIVLAPNLGVQTYRADTDAALGIRTMYVLTLGLSLQHADSQFQIGKRSNNRSITSLEMRLCPLFLVRWSQATELGPPLLDLTLDSLALGIGAFWDYDRNQGYLRRGTSLSAGLSLPLFAKASGPWLDATMALRLAEGPAYSAQANVMYGLALSWAWFVDSRLHDDNP